MNNTEQLTATSIVSLFETTKPERATFVKQIVDEISEGNCNPLTIHLQIRCMEDIIKNLKDNPVYKEMLLKEATKNGKTFGFHNSTFEIREAGTKYHYNNCNDPLLAELEQQAAEAAEALKKRQEFLKSIPESGLEVGVDDELIKMFPPSKSSTTSVTVSLK